MKYWPTKTPGAIRDLGLNWQPTLAKLGDLTIVDSSWEKLNGPGDCSGGDFTTTRTVVRILGGEVGNPTVYRNTVTLSNGQIIDEDVMQKVRA